ncbi:MAG: hypothetical protein M0Q51_04850 [Bacteroidales bacterium]|nr:hypothetical protein [Bacteroidales bacterium]
MSEKEDINSNNFNPANDWKKQVIEALGLPPQSEYSKKNVLKYNSAKSIDELLIYYGEALLLSTASIIKRLKMPNPSGIRLGIMSIINKKYTDQYYFGFFNLFSLGILFVFNEAKEYLKEDVKYELDEEDYELLLNSSGVYFTELLGLKKDSYRENEFVNIFFKYIDFYNIHPVVKNSDFIDKIKEFYEIHYFNNVKMDSKSFFDFFGLIAMRNHLALLDTPSFIENYKRLKRDSKL